MKENIVFWNPWWENKTLKNKIRKRDFFEELERLLKRKETIFITGVRRSGKTSAMFHLINHLLKNNKKENILYLNLDDSPFQQKTLDQIYEEYTKIFSEIKGKKYVFLDEIQNIDEWERWIKKNYDSQKNIKFIISGSKSSLLKKNAHILTGRMLEQKSYPLSYKEFLDFKKQEITELNKITKKIKYLNLFEEYVNYGGFPEPVLETDERTKILLLKEYYENIKDKDIITYFDIKEAKKFDNLSLFIISNFAKLYSANKIGKAINLSTSIVENYLSYAEMMYFFLTLNNYDYSIKGQITKPRKIFIIDTGLIKANSFTFSENKGRLLENVVFLQLKRQNKEIYYHKDKYECDFVVKEGLKIKETIQVCHEITNDNKDREIKGLMEAMVKHNLKQGILLTYDQEEEIKKDNKIIHIKPVWKWLIED